MRCAKQSFSERPPSRGRQHAPFSPDAVTVGEDDGRQEVHRELGRADLTTLIITRSERSESQRGNVASIERQEPRAFFVDGRL
jgi:hypothetical protein